MSVRLLTVGPVPPEWGGQSCGGVATFHRTFAEHAACDLAIITESGGTSPVPLLSPPEREQQRWYAIHASRFDAVLMLHVGHRWAIYHARERPCPAVAAVRSWTPMLSRTGEDADRMRQRITAALAAMDVLVFPSEYSRRQGEQLGFAYPAPAYVVPNPIATLFAEPVDVERARSGVVFVGTPAKNPHLVIDACRRLGVSCTIIVDRSHVEVRRALLRAEALCVPSGSESFGNVYTEAIACGTPVVGFGPTVKEISDTCGVDIGVGVASPTTGNVTAALAEVLARAWQRDRLRKAALRAFHPAAIAARYLDLVGSVSIRAPGASLTI